MPLTDVRIRSLKPKERFFKAYDEGGLFLLAAPSGSRLWRLKYRYDQKEKLLALGRYPEISLKDARARAFSARQQIANGIDPSQERKLEQSARLAASKNSFGVIADELVAKISKAGKSPVTIRKPVSFLDMNKPVLGNMPVTEIKAPDMLKLLKPIEEARKIETANRVKAAIPPNCIVASESVISRSGEVDRGPQL